LVDSISRHYKDEIIVLRPHPMEDISIYKFFLKDNPNIIVTNEGPVDSWIRLAKVVLQYGCTTAIQADFARKPVITFIPKSINDSEFKKDYFPNKIGKEISNFEDFKLNFDRLDTSVNFRNVWINNISDIDTFEFFSKEILEHIQNDKSYFSHSIPVSLKLNFIENAKNLLKHILNKNVHELENFDHIEDFFSAASKFYNYKVNTIRLNKYCYIVEGKK